MKPPSRHRSVLLLLVAAFVAAGVGAIFKAADALPEVELSTIDTRFGIRGATDPRSDVVIVGIDDRTLEEDPNVSFPFNRRRHARVIRQLTKAGASVIAYDVQFTEPGPYPDADEALLQAVRAGKKRVVLSTTEVGLDGSTSIFGGGETLKYSRAIPAITNFANDEDGVLRHMSFNEHQLDTFAMAAARVHEGHAISTPGSDSARIAYAGPAGTIPQLSFGEVERGSFDADAVRGKIVVVGATATALGDVHKTAADDAMSGPELQASAIATALDGFPLHTAGWVDWLLILALASIAPLVAMRFGTAVALIVGVIAVPAFLLGAQLAFNEGVIVSIIPPLAAAFTSLVGTVLVANPASSPWVNRVLDRVSSGEGMNLRTRRLRALMLVGTAFFVLVFGLAFQAGNVLERLELVTVDNRFDIRGSQPPGPVTVVAIDDETFNELGSAQWPFTRALHTKVIRQLKKAGAKVIIYDVQFTEPSGNDDNDTALIDTVRAARNVVLSSTEISEDGTTRIFGGGEALEYSRGIPGNGNVENDVDGRVRRVPYDSQKLESLSMAALRVARNGRPVSHPPGDSAWIDYAGPPRTVQYLSFGRVAKGKFPASAVRGKYVVVGASAPSLQDLHQTSTTGSGEMPGPEVWANAITTGLNGFPLDTISWWKDSLLLVLLAVITPLAALRMRTGLALALGAASSRRVPRGRADRIQRRRDRHGDLPPAGRTPRDGRDGRHPRPDRCVRAGQHARRVRALRARVRRRPGPPGRRRSAPGRRARRGDGDVQRPAWVHVVRRDARARAGHRLAQPLSDRDERGDPRSRRNARRLHGRRHHGRVRRAAVPGGPRRSRARGREGHARAGSWDSTTRCARTACTKASRWASASTPAR